MKNLLVILALSIGLTHSFNSFQVVNAEENIELSSEEIIEQELAVAIISGDGSADNPYIVDYDLAPTFKIYMDDINETVMESLNVNQSISTFGIYDGILQGEYRYNQTNGGCWVYHSGPPSATWNGNIWMRKVIYVPVDETAALSLQYDSGVRSALQSYGADFFAQPLSDIKDELIEAGFDAFGASAFYKAVGRINSIFSVAETMAFVIDYFNATKYNEARRNGYGMINATYQTSYNGSWYAHYGEDTWTTPHTVRFPSTNYGIGSYTQYYE